MNIVKDTGVVLITFEITHVNNFDKYTYVCKFSNKHSIIDKIMNVAKLPKLYFTKYPELQKMYSKYYDITHENIISYSKSESYSVNYFDNDFDMLKNKNEMVLIICNMEKNLYQYVTSLMLKLGNIKILINLYNAKEIPIEIIPIIAEYL